MLFYHGSYVLFSVDLDPDGIWPSSDHGKLIFVLLWKQVATSSKNIGPATAQELSVFGVILVRIFPTFSRMRTEYGEILHISQCSVRMLENAEKMRTRITPNKDISYAACERLE